MIGVLQLKLIRHNLQSHHRSNQRQHKKHPPESDGLIEKENSRHHSANRANPRPNRISSPNRNRIASVRNRLIHQKHTDKQRDHKSSPPKKTFFSRGFLRFSEAGSKSGFKKSGNDEDNPVHSSSLKSYV